MEDGQFRGQSARLSKVLSHVDKNSPAKLSVNDIKLPDSDVVRKTQAYSKKELPQETYNHSLRVYYYATYFLTCLLHDIGTTKANLNSTHMSFEFQGGLLALNILQEHGASKSQAESVCEAIFRHQDLEDSGNISSVGQLIQLATVFDNMGINPHLIHKSTIESVVSAYPRKKWSSCFAATIREEVSLKPWSHTTAINDFAEGVESNRSMEPYE
ncbi:cyanamide hydratase [Lojkania enalia]|uniref:Cyanamide hydratase n=1 Tax=Lojkania enalia TaxID=147567 RepID=A0A9P4N764_9PLEO|nr:cyanamide hydratase [Didymosphaeria enalia]